MRAERTRRGRETEKKEAREGKQSVRITGSTVRINVLICDTYRAVQRRPTGPADARARARAAPTDARE